MTTSESTRSTGRAAGRRPGAAVAAVLTVVAAGCGGSLPRSVAGAPTLRVVTGLYPLAQVASLIGQAKASVTDVVPDGSNPLTYQPPPATSAQVRAAGLVLEVGGGFQPGFESVAAGAARVTRLATGSSPYVWLDPHTMTHVVDTVAAAMEAADPGAAALYRRNASSLQAEVGSLGIDYSSTLATCTDTALITPDPAFSALSASYSLRNVVVGPTPAPGAVAAAAGLLRAGRTTAVAGEPWVDNSGVAAVAAAAGSRTRQLDTLAGAPAGGYPSGAGYFALMEQDLGTLSGILGCASQGQ